ncbi:MAG: DUF1854 domain-containing protein [Verrucomicrobiales bacterium]
MSLPDINLSSSGQLQVISGGKTTAVRVQSCFPLSQPGRFFSLLDCDGNEVGMVENPADLDAPARAAIETALADAAFTIKVTAIESIENDIDLRIWKVVTAAGSRTFETRLGSWPRKLEDGGVLIQDVAEDLYHIEDINALDAKSRQLLWAFSD